MREEYRKKYLEIEKTNWWFAARRDMILRLLAALPREARVLEAGASSGLLIEHLRQKGFTNVYGLDNNAAAVARGKERGTRGLLLGDCRNLCFRDSVFDVVIASDLLEHLQDERSALRQWRSVLKAGGLLILFVPAHTVLWSGHDEVNMHYRRYAPSSLAMLLKQNGFCPLRASGWNIALFPAAMLFRFFSRLRNKTREPADQFYALPDWLNTLLALWLKLENRWLARWNLSPGISAFFVAKAAAGQDALPSG